jgi:hypothetical protein
VNAFLGSRGLRFKSGRPDQRVQVRRGSGFSLGPLFDLREPIGEPPRSHVFVMSALAKRASWAAAWPVLPAGWQAVPQRAEWGSAGVLLAPHGGAGPEFASG